MLSRNPGHYQPHLLFEESYLAYRLQLAPEALMGAVHLRYLLPPLPKGSTAKHLPAAERVNTCAQGASLQPQADQTGPDSSLPTAVVDEFQDGNDELKLEESQRGSCTAEQSSPASSQAPVIQGNEQPSQVCWDNTEPSAHAQHCGRQMVAADAQTAQPDSDSGVPPQHTGPRSHADCMSSGDRQQTEAPKQEDITAEAVGPAGHRESSEAGGAALPADSHSVLQKSAPRQANGPAAAHQPPQGHPAMGACQSVDAPVAEPSKADCLPGSAAKLKVCNQDPKPAGTGSLPDPSSRQQVPASPGWSLEADFAGVFGEDDAGADAALDSPPASGVPPGGLGQYSEQHVQQSSLLPRQAAGAQIHTDHQPPAQRKLAGQEPDPSTYAQQMDLRSSQPLVLTQQTEAQEPATELGMDVEAQVEHAPSHMTTQAGDPSPAILEAPSQAETTGRQATLQLRHDQLFASKPPRP